MPPPPDPPEPARSAIRQRFLNQRLLPSRALTRLRTLERLKEKAKTPKSTIFHFFFIIVDFFFSVLKSLFMQGRVARGNKN